jgi:hypothetical protein
MHSVVLNDRGSAPTRANNHVAMACRESIKDLINLE